MPDWDITKRPYCGCENLIFDLVSTDEGSYDVIDCPVCKRRLYEEVY